MDLIDEINKRAKVLTEDNLYGNKMDPSYPHLLALITSAMTIGASIVIERGGPDPIPGESEEGWKRVEAALKAYHTECGTPRA
jgi:hypothetical protein